MTRADAEHHLVLSLWRKHLAEQHMNPAEISALDRALDLLSQSPTDKD